MIPQNEAEAKKKLIELMNMFLFADKRQALRIKKQCVIYGNMLTGKGRPDLARIFKQGNKRMNLRGVRSVPKRVRR